MPIKRYGNYFTNCLLLNAHKELTENLDLILIAEEFVEKLDERKRCFGNF